MDYVTLEDYDEETHPSRIKDLELLLRQALDFIQGRSKLPLCDITFMIEATIEAGDNYEEEASAFLRENEEVGVKGPEGEVETPLEGDE